MRAVCAASDEGALPAVGSHEPTPRTASVDPLMDDVRAHFRIAFFSKNGANPKAGWLMSDSWSDRAELYRTSAVHARGPDLDLMVAWAGGARNALDVATGGGHVARRLREAGLEVVSADPAPGMEPDVVCAAESLPFPDASFDVVACRRAAHHFTEPGRAVAEMARVSRDLVLLQDALYESERVEEAERLRDPSHVAHLSEQRWRELFAEHGLELEAVEHFDEHLDFDSWLARTGCEGEVAARVRLLLAEQSDETGWTYHYAVFKGRKRR